ncbi:MAG TPA: hypothetical protein VIL19_08190 [Casimicrobiaceae bacterium]
MLRKASASAGVATVVSALRTLHGIVDNLGSFAGGRNLALMKNHVRKIHTHLR